MSLYGFNRSALNGGVSGIVAGAALVMAASGFAAEGTRWVLPQATVTSAGAVQADARLALRGGASVTQSGALTATGVRGVYGQAGFVTTTTGSAFPALLQLVTADIVTTSYLHATYTHAWALSQGVLSGAGIKTQNGSGVATSLWSTALSPLVIAGFASNINAESSATADASVKFNGQITWQRDGYANASTTSALTANGLKTALGYAFAQTSSNCTTDSIKTHGGAARFDAMWTTSAVASTDAAQFEATSDLTATALAIRNSEAQAVTVTVISAAPTRTTFAGQLLSVGVSGLSADARLALLAQASQGSGLSATADARLAMLSAASVTVGSSAIASGTIYRPGQADCTGWSGSEATGLIFERGYAQIDVTSDATADARLGLLGVASADGAASLAAQWALLIESSADIAATSRLVGSPSTNAEAPDPDARTMTRPFVARDMVRPFIDRNMRRTA